MIAQPRASRTGAGWCLAGSAHESRRGEAQWTNTFNPTSASPKADLTAVTTSVPSSAEARSQLARPRPTARAAIAVRRPPGGRSARPQARCGARRRCRPTRLASGRGPVPERGYGDRDRKDGVAERLDTARVPAGCSYNDLRRTCGHRRIYEHLESVAVLKLSKAAIVALTSAATATNCCRDGLAGSP